MEEKKEHKEHTEHKDHSEHKEHSEHVSTKRKNDWKILAGVLGVIILILLAIIFFGKSFGGGLSGEKAGMKLAGYLNTKTGGGVAYVSSEDLGNIYNVIVSYQGQDIPVYVTKDGKYFIQGAIALEEDNSTDTTQQPSQPQNITKSDKPVVDLFVMTECPYGTQAEKGIIPVINALGSKADIKIKFVHYTMHGEKEDKETLTQVCIREEQSAKYITYLGCYLEDGNTERCLTKTGIDKAKLAACTADTGKAKSYYAADSAQSNQYGVEGSPTLVINGVQANSARDSASLLSTICSAFTTAPADCSKQLSSASPAPGFGTAAASGTASNSAAQCG